MQGPDGDIRVNSGTWVSQLDGKALYDSWLGPDWGTDPVTNVTQASFHRDSSGSGSSSSSGLWEVFWLSARGEETVESLGWIRISKSSGKPQRSERMCLSTQLHTTQQWDRDVPYVFLFFFLSWYLEKCDLSAAKKINKLDEGKQEAHSNICLYRCVWKAQDETNDAKTHEISSLRRK